MRFVVAVCVVYLMLISFSLVRVSIPGVNEPHYLSKAKFFWQPEWCAGDFFLESSNPHLVFYGAFGWLARFYALDTVALISRCVGLIPLAMGWTALGRKITQSDSMSVGGLAIFLVLHAAGNWSGEWLVGGIESKTIAYGFLFWSIAEAMSLRLWSAALFAGMAIAFHPIIGLWGTLAAATATVGMCLTRERAQLWENTPSLKSWIVAATLFTLAALPGLLPAIQLIMDADPKDALAATHLQVAHRLAHHLDPMMFLKTSHRYFAMLLFAWVILLAGQKAVRLESKWWRLLVMSSLFFAFIGVAIAWGPRPIKTMSGYEWRMTALKFYPFRLADILLPVAVSFSTMRAFTEQIQLRLKQPALRVSLTVCATGICWLLALWMPGSDQNPSKMNDATRANWIAAATWIDQHTPESDLVYSLENQWAVKWFANRAEYVNYKDCPQDNAGILEWNRRLWKIATWKKQATKDSLMTQSELEELHTATGIDWIVFGKYWKVDLEPAFQNQHFRVYRTTPFD